MADGANSGLGGRSKAFVLRVIVDWIVDHLKLALTALLAFTGYSVGVAEDWWPGPIDTVKRGLGTSEPTGENTVRRPLNASEIRYRNDGSAAGRIGESLHLEVLPRLNSLPGELAGLEVRYGLSALGSTSGTKSSVRLNWALRTPDSEWVTCGQDGLRFGSRDELGRAIARVLNNSFEASENGGKLRCT